MAQFAKLFAEAFSELRPNLVITTMVVDADHVACELTEEINIDGVTYVDHIAGFYRVRAGRITAARIYREGSADT